MVGVAVWCKGVSYRYPMRFDVLSPALDSSSFAAHIALLAVLRDLQEQGKLEGVTGLNVWSDGGGHFTSGTCETPPTSSPRKLSNDQEMAKRKRCFWFKNGTPLPRRNRYHTDRKQVFCVLSESRGVFAGAVLAAFPEHFGFRTASWNAYACYHGKTPWVDGGFSAAKRILNSYSMKAGNKGLWCARQAVDVLNESQGRRISKIVVRKRRSRFYAMNRKNKKTGGYYRRSGWVADPNGRAGKPKRDTPADLAEQKGPYKAILEHFGKSSDVGFLYLDIPLHRSSYCLRMRRLDPLEDAPDGDVQDKTRGKRRRLEDDPDHDSQRFARFEFKDFGESGEDSGTLLQHTFGRGSSSRTILHKPIPTRRAKEKPATEAQLKDDIEVEDQVSKRLHRELVSGKDGVKKAWDQLQAQRQELAKAWEGKTPSVRVDRGGRFTETTFGTPASMLEARLVLQKWLDEPGALRLRFERKVEKGPTRTSRSAGLSCTNVCNAVFNESCAACLASPSPFAAADKRTPCFDGSPASAGNLFAPHAPFRPARGTLGGSCASSPQRRTRTTATRQARASTSCRKPCWSTSSWP